MPYRITLTPEEYATLSAAAGQRGTTIEMLVHEVLADHFQANRSLTATYPKSEQEFLVQLLREGIISNIPTQAPDTPEEAIARERLANLISSGKLPSEMVIEDRGPR